jgi:hypothetical protein
MAKIKIDPVDDKNPPSTHKIFLSELWEIFPSEKVDWYYFHISYDKKWHFELFGASRRIKLILMPLLGESFA